MSDFVFTSPDSKRYRVTGPPGATQEQAFGILQQQLKGGGSSSGAAPPPAETAAPSDASPDNAVNSGLTDYARQTADINKKIDASLRDGALPQGADRAQYDALVGQRSALQKKAEELTGRAEKAGAKPVKFGELVKQMGERNLGGRQPGESPAFGFGPDQDLDQEALFEKRQELETRLKADGKPLKGNAEWEGLTRQIAKAQTQSARSAVGYAAPFEKGLAGAVPKLAAKAVGAPIKLGQRLLGSEAKAAMEGLKAKALTQVGEVSKSEATQAASETGRAVEIGKVRSGVGAARVATAEKEQQTAVQQTQQARGKAEAAQGEVATTEAAAKQLDERLTANPGMSKEEFGGQLEETVRGVNKRLTAERARESGYAKAIEDAGDELRVETGPIRENIEATVKDIRNPQTRRLLETIKKELHSVVDADGKETAHDALSVKSADSLRKTLNEAIHERIFDGEAVSKEALVHLKQIKKELTRAATEAWGPYKEALGKFATLSRPLEFIEKNPLLRKVVVADPAATEALVTRSQVVGKLLTQAKEDRHAFARLVAENPELRQSGRLYFAQDLFGPEGLKTVKTAVGFRNWLIKNKSALDQLGIYDEFKTMDGARRTAQQAVDKAAGVAKETAGQAKTAEKYEQGLTQKLQATRQSRSRVQARLDAWEKGRLGEAEKRAKSSAVYRQFETEITKAKSDKEVIDKTKEMAGRLAKDGKIDQRAYGEYLDAIHDAESKAESKKNLRKRALQIVALIALEQGYEYFRATRMFGGGH